MKSSTRPRTRLVVGGGLVAIAASALLVPRLWGRPSTAAAHDRSLDRALVTPTTAPPRARLQRAPPPAARSASAGWSLVWRDEFDGEAGAPVDRRSWTFDHGDGCTAGNCGWGNEEKQQYTSDLANAALTGRGTLAITARLSTDGARCYYGPCRYTSAKLKTKGKVSVRFGRVEARIRLPTGQGLWPAFWMLGEGPPSLGWPDCGELDIMEHHGSMPGNVSSAVHGPGFSGRGALMHAHTPAGVNFTADFHRYSMEWDSSVVRFSVDDREHFVLTRKAVEARGTWAFDRSFSVILNLAVGGTFDGDPTADTVLPATMLVDYVRVYTRAP
ncbi:MAG: glycoside hydrolase family 16 protein [Gemmatimonadota bacterium]